MRFSKGSGPIVHDSACVGVSGVRLQKDNCFKKRTTFPVVGIYVCTRCLGSYVGLVKREGGYGQILIMVRMQTKKGVEFPEFHFQIVLFVEKNSATNKFDETTISTV